MRLMAIFVALALASCAPMSQSIQHTLSGTQPYQVEPAGSYCGHMASASIEILAANVPAHLTAWSGIHKGWTDTSICTALITERISPSGEMKVTFIRSGQFHAWGSKPYVYQGTVKVSGGRIAVPITLSSGIPTTFYLQLQGQSVLVSQAGTDAKTLLGRESSRLARN